MPPERVIIRVPATTANLGPGFDCLGMALDIYNIIAVARSDSFSITINGEGANTVSKGHDNLIYKAIKAVYQEIGQPVPGLNISCQNNIPLRRGLGSSAAAAAGGLMAANLLAGEPLPLDRLLHLGWLLEGHPDNITPALFGGCQVVVIADHHLTHVRIPLPSGLEAVLFIPNFEIPTRKARMILSQQVSREDAVFNISRTALLATALATGQLEHLKLATQDRIHQPQRQALFPAMPIIFEAALSAGAKGVFLSGSGSSILALTDEANHCTAIAEAMSATATRAGVGGRTLLTRPIDSGVYLVSKE